MKAIVIKQPGDADVMVWGDAPDPQPADDELLVRVRAAGVNRAEVFQRMGNYPPPPGVTDILGLELAGEVVRESGGWKVGDRVMGIVGGGAYAELAALPAGMAMRIPDRFSYEEAAAIPEGFLTGYMNLFTLGKLQPDETALIHAGASGVGVAAIQLARAVDAFVITTAGSDDKLARLRDLDADVTVNYRAESFVERALEITEGRGANMILDFIGAPYWNDNLKALARGGRLLLIGFLGGSRGELDIGLIMRKNLMVTGTSLRWTPLEQKLQLVRDLRDFALPRFESGELRPVVDSVFPIEQAADAHRYMEANRNFGKIVLSVK